MIDVEADVFNYVYPRVSTLVPKGCFKSVYLPAPPAFPFATLYEVDSYTTPRMWGTTDSETHATLTYEANVYAEDKYECKDIMSAIDTAMHELNFRRTMMQSVPNLADSTLFRLTARYTAVADANKTMYRTY